MNNKPFHKLIALGLSAALLATLWGCKNKNPDPTQPNPTEPSKTQQTAPTTSEDPTNSPEPATSPDTTNPTEPTKSLSDLIEPDATTPLVPLDPQEPTTGIVLAPTSEIALGSDLYITDIGEYTGIYMEDGVDDFVTGIMMVVLNNRSQQDLQLAQIDLVYDGFTANFHVTNLPAGQSVVLLEKNRHAYENQTHTDVAVSNLAFFQAPMGLRQDQLKITQGQGSLTVENITDAPMGEIFIYYKNSASDILYGGITYRTRLSDGLAPGESKTLVAAHFNPGASTVMDVQITTPEN